MDSRISQRGVSPTSSWLLVLLCILSATHVNSGLTAPQIMSITAADPDNSDSVFGNMDTITIEFDINTNMPAANNKEVIDRMFQFSQTIGDDYSGSWVDPKLLVVTVLDAASAAPDVLDLQITCRGDVLGSIQILDDGIGTDPCNSQSPVLRGNWGYALFSWSEDSMRLVAGSISSLYIVLGVISIGVSLSTGSHVEGTKHDQIYSASSKYWSLIDFVQFYCMLGLLGTEYYPPLITYLTSWNWSNLFVGYPEVEPVVTHFPHRNILSIYQVAEESGLEHVHLFLLAIFLVLIPCCLCSCCVYTVHDIDVYVKRKNGLSEDAVKSDPLVSDRGIALLLRFFLLSHRIVVALALYELAYPAVLSRGGVTSWQKYGMMQATAWAIVAVYFVGGPALIVRSHKRSARRHHERYEHTKAMVTFGAVFADYLPSRSWFMVVEMMSKSLFGLVYLFETDPVLQLGVGIILQFVTFFTLVALKPHRSLSNMIHDVVVEVTKLVVLGCCLQLQLDGGEEESTLMTIMFIPAVVLVVSAAFQCVDIYGMLQHRSVKLNRLQRMVLEMEIQTHAAAQEKNFGDVPSRTASRVRFTDDNTYEFAYSDGSGASDEEDFTYSLADFNNLLADHGHVPIAENVMPSGATAAQALRDSRVTTKPIVGVNVTDDMHPIHLPHTAKVIQQQQTLSRDVVHGTGNPGIRPLPGPQNVPVSKQTLSRVGLKGIATAQNIFRKNLENRGATSSPGMERPSSVVDDRLLANALSKHRVRMERAQSTIRSMTPGQATPTPGQATPTPGQATPTPTPDLTAPRADSRATPHSVLYDDDVSFRMVTPDLSQRPQLPPLNTAQTPTRTRTQRDSSPAPELQRVPSSYAFLLKKSGFVPVAAITTPAARQDQPTPTERVLSRQTREAAALVDSIGVPAVDDGEGRPAVPTNIPRRRPEMATCEFEHQSEYEV